MDRLERLFDRIEWVIAKIGFLMGWLMAFLVLLVTGDVISRYLFNTGMVIIQEAEWWLFSIIFLMGAGFTYISDSHVRVDIIYSQLSDRGRNWVDLICGFVFLLPMCVLIMYTSFFFIRDSWEVSEISPDPGGFPAYYVLKAFIPLGFFFLALEGIVKIIRIIRELRSDDPAPAKVDSP